MKGVKIMTDLNKLTLTMKVFDEYEGRFNKKRFEHKPKYAFKEDDRNEIIKTVKEILKLDETLIPEIKIHSTQEQTVDGITVKHMMFESWKSFYGISSLFIPDNNIPRPAPLVVICPGHGKEGRLTRNYQRMAQRLAKQGAYTLLLENIGQGCRSHLGHYDVPEVFYCGLTVQGLIVAETCAWIRYMKNETYIDSSRIGAAGNSGGGTLTQFLCATEPSLCAVASCGYPSEYEYIFQKERRHCDCNILPGIIGKLEMWEVYSTFSPKPMLLNAGSNDDLIPVEYFRINARKVSYIYSAMNKSNNFKSAVTSTKHPWDDPDLDAITGFFKEIFLLNAYEPRGDETLISSSDVTLEFPDDAITTAILAQNISGVSAPYEISFTDIFKPSFNGNIINSDDIISDLGRGDLMRVFSQFEASLKD